MFEEASSFAQRIKFSGDISLPISSDVSLAIKSRLKNNLLKSELCISESVTPALYRSVKEVCCKLGIEADKVIVFVYPSANYNAECYANDKENCIIRVSSSLVDILSTEEFEFVISHELGHFLLSHYGLGENDNSYEYYILRRAQEISADRIGLLGSASLQVALSALLKTSSGLSNHHLKFDFGSFVSQLQQVSEEGSTNDLSTHPAVTVRCRALLWFSMSTSFINQDKTFNKLELEKLDKRIQHDLDKFENGFCHEEISLSKFDLDMWVAAKIIVSEGKFSKENRAKFASKFGDRKLTKLLSFLEGCSTEEVLKRVSEKYEFSHQELLKLTPRQFDSTLNYLIRSNKELFATKS